MKVSAQTEPESGKITIATHLNVGDRMNLMWTSVDETNYPIKITGAKPVTVEGKIAYEITKKPVILEGPIKTFECTMSGVTGLEFENCIYLTDLICGTNAINYLDLTGLKSLELLNTSSSDVNTVKLDGCVNLKEIIAFGNKIKSINLTACPKLESVSLETNALTEIDLNGVTCRALSLTGNQLTSVDISTMKNLQDFRIAQNPLKSIKLQGCDNLKKLHAKHTQLTEVDLSGLAKLEWAELNNCNISKITLKGNESLATLELSSNKLSEIDLTGCAASLEELQLNRNQFTKIHLKDLSNIMMVNLRENKITEFSMEGCEWLAALVLSDNLLTSIDVSNAKEGLSELYVDGNQLTKLDLSGFTELTWIGASKNQISEVNFEGCTSLQHLDLSSNAISALTLPFTTLSEVHLYDNNLRGEAMTALMNSLPAKKSLTSALREGEDPTKPINPSDTTTTTPKAAGQLFIVKTRDNKEQNLCLVSDVKIAVDKGWGVYDMRDRSDYKGAQKCKITSRTEGKGGSILVNGKTTLEDVYTDTKVQITAKTDEGYALKSLMLKTKDGSEIDIFKDRYFYASAAEAEVVATFTDDICKVTLKRMGDGILKLDGDGLDLNGLPRGMEFKIIAKPVDENAWELGGLYKGFLNDKGKMVYKNIKGEMGFTLDQNAEILATFDPVDDSQIPTDTLVWDGKEWHVTTITNPVVETIIQAQVYPNPATDYVIISEAQPAAAVQVYTLTGSLIRTFATNAEGAAELSVADLPEGTYVILIGNDPRKLIIRR